MQAKQTAVIWTIIICAVLVVGAVYLMIPEIPEQKPYPVYDIPTAQEVADLIVIPDFDTPNTRLSIRQALKADAISVCNDEFDFDEVEDLFDSEDKVALVREYIDDRDYFNINIGVDNLDDREISVDRVYKVEVEPDIDDDYRDKVYVTCVVTSDDGELEAEIDYSL